MTSTTIILISILALCLVAMGALLFWFLRTEPDSQLSTLSSSGRSSTDSGKTGSISGRQVSIEEVQRKLAENQGEKRAKDSPDIMLFRAGIFSKEEKEKFVRTRKLFYLIVAPTAATLFFIVLNHLGGFVLGFLGVILGLMVGFLYPRAKLDKRARLREEEYMYYLPLVIEQISIGVSSALDIGPCVAYVVEMADQRSSHNAVTELLVQVLKLMRAGMGLDEALSDVGEVVGLNEVKNAFMFLSQCSKHGGEVSKQLQELSDSVSLARQLMIEAKITALPTKATGALAMVFMGFFGMILSGVVVRLAEGMS
ncbi:MAG TPA: type II secretion system F family protein [Oligoflexia bacterium]|nr:type II secretion system F family protein [Oligoflexia bacterium]HMP47086.1 type II secretion system F family protein [Oligoflexia bacterium]